VAVGSTRRHWFDLNLQGMMIAAPATGDRTQTDEIFGHYGKGDFPKTSNRDQLREGFAEM
jgi:hypothetical protein